MAEAYKEGRGWAFRLRVNGQDVYRSGFKTRKAAQDESDALAVGERASDKPALLGAQRTSVAQGLSDYAREVLPGHKGAKQEARRINRYLRALGLPVIHLEEFKAEAPIKQGLQKRKRAAPVHWTVTLVRESERAIPSSLQEHRAGLAREAKETEAMRRRLARTMMADVTRHDLQRFVDTMETEGFYL